jgi:hypothetical protein
MRPQYQLSLLEAAPLKRRPPSTGCEKLADAFLRIFLVKGVRISCVVALNLAASAEPCPNRPDYFQFIILIHHHA